MSSDKERAVGILSHPYYWQIDTWKHVKERLDAKYLETCPPRSDSAEKNNRNNLRTAHTRPIWGVFVDLQIVLCLNVQRWHNIVFCVLWFFFKISNMYISNFNFSIYNVSACTWVKFLLVNTIDLTKYVYLLS